MKRYVKSSLCALVALVWISVVAATEPLPDRVGDRFQLDLQVHTKQTSRTSSGTSNSNLSFIETVTAVDTDGIELEFDLPENTSPDVRARDWQFPIVVRKAADKPLQLINGAELSARIDRWLELGGLTRSDCGRWVFTWTAIKIECDPEVALASLASYDLRPADVRDGALYSVPGALAAGPLHLVSADEHGDTFTVELDLDPAVIRQELAEEEIAIAQMSGRLPPTLEQALQSLAISKVMGNIEITLEVNEKGVVVRRTQVTNVEIIDSADGTQHRSSTAILERTLISPRAAVRSLQSRGAGNERSSSRAHREQLPQGLSKRLLAHSH
jgi:hypothetical protein